MTTTAVQAAIRERLDPALEAMITRELIGQGTSPSAIPGAQQQPGAQFAALAPALIAAMTGQQLQQVSVPQPPSPLATLLPVLVATLVGQQPQPIPMQQPKPLAALVPALMAMVAGQGPQQSPLAPLFPALIAAVASQSQQVPVPQPPSPLAVLFPFLMTTEVTIMASHPHLLKELIELRLRLAPVLLAALASQPQQVPMPQQSPLATLFPVLMATLAMQQQPAQPSPLLSALSCALAPAIASAITSRLREGKERDAGKGRR